MNRSYDQLKEMFWDLFRNAKCRAGHMVPFNQVRSFKDKLNPLEQETLNQLINDLFTDGFITETPNDGRPQGFVLTEMGYNKIYKVRSDTQLENEIMNRFPHNCRVRDIIRMPSLWIDLKENLNPKEYDKMTNIIENLINKEYISYEKSPFECLRLEQNGFDYIYR